MNSADEMAARLEPTQRQLDGAAAGSDDKDLDEQLRVSVEALIHPSPPPKPVEELDDLLSAISLHLDEEASERKAIYNRLRAIETGMERPASRGFRGYLLALCIGVAAYLAWQSYGEATKQIIATKAPELGWSPQAKQMIASWMQQFGWTKPPASTEKQAGSVARTAHDTVASKAPPVLSLDPQQVQQIGADIAAVRQVVERHLADIRETVGQLAANQEQMMSEVTKLRAADQEILDKIPAPPPKRSAAPARKPTPIAPPTARAPPPHP